MKTKLSVNINKIALIRNSRGGNNPDIVQIAQDIESYGAQGITVHPRPDERHIRYADLNALKTVVTTELNVEGNPTTKFVDEVLKVKPHQVTLVPDKPEALTSDAGWNTIKHAEFLSEITSTFKSAGIRVSVFVDPIESMIEGAAKLGIDRIELYTEEYAQQYGRSTQEATTLKYKHCALLANQLGLGVNAGHDLNLTNLARFSSQIPNLDEVSIGHALVADSLYLGLQNTVNLYLQKLN